MGESMKFVKRILRFFTNKITIISFIALLQMVIFVLLVLHFADQFTYFMYFNYFVSALMILFVLRSDDLRIYKMSWIIPILIAPVFGGLFYLTFKPLNVTRKLTKKHMEKDSIRKTQLMPLIKEPTAKLPSSISKQITYLSNDVWPFYTNTKLEFLPSGEVKLSKVIEELKKAKKSVFIEYFILEETGFVFQAMYPILVEKAKEGLDVRLLYDDWGSSLRVKKGFKKRMERVGIKTEVFNPLRLKFQVSLQYRDHRKMIIIDGSVGFTGGINIADEYANIKKRFGHWHDAGILLRGDAVYSMTASFLESWDLYRKETTDITKFIPNHDNTYDGYVVPYSDSPFTKNFTTRNIYTQMIALAKKEIYITTPYFVVDEELINTLKMQALSGVKVHIIFPGIPDKKFVYVVTKYYLRQLADVPNVYIHEYTAGFVHSKILYIDDAIATVGTVNFDFRSFYLHFENTVWFYESSCLKDMKVFLEETMSKSKILTAEDLGKRNVFYKIYEAILVETSHLL